MSGEMSQIICDATWALESINVTLKPGELQSVPVYIWVQQLRGGHLWMMTYMVALPVEVDMCEEHEFTDDGSG
jgi:hypothetical protein